MRRAGCVFVGVVFAAILFFGGHVTVLTSQKPASPADAPAATSAQVSWLIFVDDLHLDFVSTGRLRDVLRTAVSRRWVRAPHWSESSHLVRRGCRFLHPRILSAATPRSGGS